MKYLHWNETTITDFSDASVGEMYEKGYVFTRLGKGVMHQTRSVRIDLSQFKLSSENRRILKKVSDLGLDTLSLPLDSYTFLIGKLAKDFYQTKFGPGIMSAQKIKEILTSPSSNFNALMVFTDHSDTGPSPIGYSICYVAKEFFHYSYPFYDIMHAPKEMGMGMMNRAIQHAVDSGMKYIYLGSLQRPSDAYKLQFSGLEWFDGKGWKTDMDEVKKILASDSINH